MGRKSLALAMIASKPGDFCAATAGDCVYGATGSTSIRTISEARLGEGDGVTRDKAGWFAVHHPDVTREKLPAVQKFPASECAIAEPIDSPSGLLEPERTGC